MTGYAATLPERVGVYGGGRMGAGIAHLFVAAGAQVVVVEGSTELATAAHERIAASLAKAAERGTLGIDREAVAAAYRTTTEPADLAQVALVVEAVPEDVGLKREVLARAETLARACTLSSIAAARTGL